VAAGEPQSLARTAERFDDAALSAGDDATRRERLLAGFVPLFRAADRAAAADWPDDLWRGWRYRRASLARVLANEGMMQNVAQAYTNARSEGRWPRSYLCCCAAFEKVVARKTLLTSMQS
jgi:hypothetical protein